jgi:hypothetical protein
MGSYPLVQSVDYGLDPGRIFVGCEAGRDVSLYQSVQTSSGAH